MHEFESRNHIEDGIVEVLSRGEVKIVGICGMGGAGKTTLAVKIASRMKAQDLFPAVVKVVVSRPLDKSKIQQVIMDSLDFKEDERKVEDIELRARLLCSKLQGPKKLLILLDDIWETFSLEELGIGECATLITSRDQNVLKKMCDNTVFEIGTLPQDEAQCLFEQESGIRLNDPNFRPMAEQILQECGALPLAIASIGSALRNKMKPDYERALRYLKSSKPIKEAEDVHARIRVSYELLDDEDTKLLFLLCSLFPEDHSISISDLELYMMGLTEVNSLVEVRDRVWDGVNKLKSCYLLLEGNKETEVRMHDVVRDVAISISKKEGRMSKDQYDKECEWISEFISDQNRNEPFNHLIGTNFSNIRLLIIHHQSYFWRVDRDINGILKGMQGLYVASFKKVGFESPPEEIGWPNNLLTLQLESMSTLETLSFVGALLNLKILDCSGCEGIEQLPVEIGRLNRLKLLNLTGCKKLQRIAPGVIKQLVELEELKMLDSFNKWESSKVNDEEGMNVRLNELGELRKLRCLEIHIEDTSLVDEKMDISKNLLKYRIRFGHKLYDSFPSDWIFNYEKVICLGGLPNEICTNYGSWIHKLLDKAGVEWLKLVGDGAGNMANLSVTHHTLKRLQIYWDERLEEAIDSSIIISVDSSGSGVVFPMLEHLELCWLPNLKQICSGQFPEGSISYRDLTTLHLFKLPSLEHILKSDPFNNLRKVVIRECDKLLNLFLSGTATDQLETLEIEECERMEQVFISNESDENGKITFPKLKRLKLKSLESLTTFWKGKEHIEFPSLEELEMKECYKMKSMVMSSGMESESEYHCENHEAAHQNLPYLCAHKATFGRLKYFTLKYNRKDIWCPQFHESCFRTLESLNIYNCDNIRCLFSPSMVKDFVNLNYLRVWKCDALEELLRNEKNSDEGTTCHITFPKLVMLELVGLRSLKSVAKGIESIEFPMLEQLVITYCPKLKRIVSVTEYNADEGFHVLCDEKVKFNKLRNLEISYCRSFSSVFTCTLAGNLTALKNINIKECHQIKKLITSENGTDGDNILLPSLEVLEISNMALLEMLCECKCPLELSMLEEIRVVECPNFKFLTNGSLSLPKLWIMIAGNKTYQEEEWKVAEDLNRFLSQHVTATKEVWKKLGNIHASGSCHKSLPLANAVWLYYIQKKYTASEYQLLVITSNDKSEMRHWMYDDPMLETLHDDDDDGDDYDDGIISYKLHNDAKSTQHNSIASLALSRDDLYIAVYTSGEVVSLLKADSFIEVSTFTKAPAATTYLAFHPQYSKVIAIGLDDSTIQIYDWRNREVITTLKSGHQKRISGLAFSGSLEILVSSGADAQLCVWSINGWEKKNSRPIQVLSNHPAPLDGETRVHFFNHEYRLLVVHESQIGIYDPTTQLECLCMWSPREDTLPAPISCATPSCDGQIIYVGFYDGAVGIFDSRNLALLRRIASSAYTSSLSPNDGDAFPTVMDIAAHPKYPHQFVLGLSDGIIYVNQPLDVKTKSEGSSSQVDTMLPSSSSENTDNE